MDSNEMSKYINVASNLSVSHQSSLFVLKPWFSKKPTKQKTNHHHFFLFGLKSMYCLPCLKHTLKYKGGREGGRKEGNLHLKMTTLKRSSLGCFQQSICCWNFQSVCVKVIWNFHYRSNGSFKNLAAVWIRKEKAECLLGLLEKITHNLPVSKFVLIDFIKVILDR